MDVRHPLSRRRFFGGVAAAVGALGLRPSGPVRAGRHAQFRGSRRGLRQLRQARQQREQLGPARVGHEGDERRVEVRQPLRLSGRQHRPGDCRPSRREAREHPAHRRLGRSAAGRRHDVPAGRQEGPRRRSDLRLGVSARHEHQGRGDQAPAPQGLPPGHPRDDRGGQQERQGHRLLLSLQPEQPDRRGRDGQGSEAGHRRHSEGHADPDRRGLPPLRRRPGLRHLDAVRARRPPGDHRAHVLEDRGARGDAHRLRRVDAGDHPARCGRTRWAASTCSPSGAPRRRSRTRRARPTSRRRSSTSATRRRASSRRTATR